MLDPWGAQRIGVRLQDGGRRSREQDYGLVRWLVLSWQVEVGTDSAPTDALVRNDLDRSELMFESLLNYRIEWRGVIVELGGEGSEDLVRDRLLLIVVPHE